MQHRRAGEKIQLQSHVDIVGWGVKGSMQNDSSPRNRKATDCGPMQHRSVPPLLDSMLTCFGMVSGVFAEPR